MNHVFGGYRQIARRAVVWLLDGTIAVYVIACLYFMAFGKINTHIMGVRVLLEDMLNPLGILAFSVFLRLIATPRFRKPVVFSALTAVISITLISFIFLLGEGYIRYFHSSIMSPIKTTYNDTSRDEMQWRGPVPPKGAKSGRRLIMVQGDSLTWGVGVSDWKLLYPNQLLERLNAGAVKYDMVTLAKPGMEINWHNDNLVRFAETLAPDIIIYQWYINDIEITKKRPPFPSESWRDLSFFRAISSHSFLYRVLQQRVDALLSKALGTDYQRYLINRYGENTEHWQEFLFQFHSWANRAQASSKRVIMFMYPCVPYRGEYPFEDINRRIKELCGPHVYTISAPSMRHIVGSDINDASLKFGKARMASPKDPQGHLVYGPYLPFGAGESSATFWLESANAKDGAVAEIDIDNDMGKTIYARRTINKSDFGGEKKWLPFTLKFNLDKFTQGLEFRVFYKGNGDLYADRIEVPVKNNIEVVDMLPYLSGFDTHATILDSHPNARAHAVIASELYNRITR
jgi:lysophospholipase L1-like esterase